MSEIFKTMLSAYDTSTTQAMRNAVFRGESADNTGRFV